MDSPDAYYINRLSLSEEEMFVARTLRSLRSSVGLTLAVVTLAGCDSDTHKPVVAQPAQVNAGVTPGDVIQMTRAGVNEELIINNIRAHGMAAPLQLKI